MIMKRFANASLTVLLALTLLLPTSSVARAEEFDCQDDSLEAVTVDNLRVPQDATCMLTGTHVQGTIKVEMNATLYASNVEVVGNVQAENAARVEMLPGSVVSGSIQIVQSVAALVDSVWINGDLFLNANESSLTVTKNRIGGNLQVFQNTGGVTIADNIIEGNLQCKENDPAPTGEGNLVKGNIEDQCVGLGVELKQRMFLPLLGLIAYAPGIGAPETTIGSGPGAATEGTGATFECERAFCASLVGHTDLNIGKHVFGFRAAELSENVDPTPASDCILCGRARLK